MPSAARFDEVLEAVDRLSPDEQADLVDVIRQRLAEQGRQRIIEDVTQGRADFEQGRVTTGSVDDLMREITS